MDYKVITLELEGILEGDLAQLFHFASEGT